MEISSEAEINTTEFRVVVTIGIEAVSLSLNTDVSFSIDINGGINGSFGLSSIEGSGSLGALASLAIDLDSRLRRSTATRAGRAG